MSKKIMIVDDEPGVVAVIQSYFETMDYQVITAHNGSDAMKKNGTNARYYFVRHKSAGY